MSRYALPALLLLPLHLAALGASFLAPHDPSYQDRLHPFAPPTPPRFVGVDGSVYLRPFVYGLRERSDEPGRYATDPDRIHPLRFFVLRETRDGRARRVLFDVEPPGRVFLLGTDGLGRDVYSRLLHGARLSLAAGMLAAGISLTLGLALGTIAGYYGRLVDAAIMRGAELFLALPWLYLLFAVRAALPLRLDPTVSFFAIALLLGLIDWARPARLFRGVALAARSRGFVLAARGFGASDAHILRRHLLPEARGVWLTQAAILVPQYVLAEVTLSYLGLGISEPGVSWGTLLAPLQRYHVLVSYWWMWTPALAVVAVFLGYYALAEALRGHRGLALPSRQAAPLESPRGTARASETRSR